jgi:hypothetical protein
VLSRSSDVGGAKIEGLRVFRAGFWEVLQYSFTSNEGLKGEKEGKKETGCDV